MILPTPVGSSAKTFLQCKDYPRIFSKSKAFFICLTPHSSPFGKSAHKHRRLSLGIDERYRLTFDWRFTTLSQSEIRVHWWTHNSKNPTNWGRREFNSTPHQSPCGFASRDHGFAIKSTRARHPASYAGYRRPKFPPTRREVIRPPSQFENNLCAGVWFEPTTPSDLRCLRCAPRLPLGHHDIP